MSAVFWNYNNIIWFKLYVIYVLNNHRFFTSKYSVYIQKSPNLLNLTTQQGGIQNNETFNFITYCALGGTIFIPSDFNNIIPGWNLMIPPLYNQMNFSQEMGIILNPGTNIITYY